MGEKKKLDRDMARSRAKRRVALIGGVFCFIFGIAGFLEELNGGLLESLDDFIFLAIGIIIIILFLIYRNTFTNRDLNRFLNVTTLLLVLGLVFKLLAIGALEARDLSALGDDYPSVILILLVIIYRFL
ncbi:MAG: hypothetical protein MjAS7_2208 [Metallosphaera javensis (ex Sakai et al. 2022)]|nr:MAG: hypothetical protein MjAS7_2208 [Metallosphaera javensis (ex Sakai et al. 2022)]